ncbi:MAG: hypothetical protein K5754_04630 [Butyrivibrio sp.]|nr:hypothetical protein [Butyrivibrio sp.]
MKKIVIGFEDFFSGFDPYDNVIYRLLNEKYEVEIVDTTQKNERNRVQYLFFSAFGNKYLEYKCIRIFVTGENLFPNFNLCDYAIGFEYMDYEDRYIRFPIYLWDRYSKDYELILKDRAMLAGERPEKRNFCGIVVSNDLFADPMRKELFEALGKYKRVDSGGKAYNNIGKPEGVENKNEFLSGYKFSIACENSSYSGYCTEKLMQAFAAGNIPIYWGDKRAVEVFNKDAFIDCTGLSTEEAVEKVKKIDEDDEAYLKMINANVLLNPKHKEEYENKLSLWLSNIVEQDYKKAKRIPSYGKMAVYEQNYHKKVIMEAMIKKHKKIYSVIKSIFIKD